MKGFKGTPGPWCVHDNGVFYDIQTHSGINIGDICASQHAFDESVHHGLVATANANLIAAAPELLEALLRVRAQFSQAGFSPIAGSLNPVEDNFAFINSAIAKALGESQ